MSDEAISLATIKANLIAKIADLTENPKPNYSIDGQQVSHSDHLRTLLDSLKEINAMIRETGEDGEGAVFEFQTEIKPC